MNRVTLCLVMVAGILGCSKFRKIQRQGDWQAKYEAALDYYKKEEYHRTIILLEEILPIIRGTKEAELGIFYIAYAYYYQKQYILSAHHFSEFVTIYGRSEYVIEATFMHAYSLYLQSPAYHLDQTNTYEAMVAMQNFINRYPASKYASEADQIIDEMQVKLETKSYNIAKSYYKLRRYRSALVTFENFKNDFPDSKYNEEIAFLKIETGFELAQASIRSKQEERYRDVTESYEKFLDIYPKSKFLSQAEKFYSESIEELTKFAQLNQK